MAHSTLDKIKSHFDQHTQTYIYDDEKAFNDTIAWHKRRALFLKTIFLPLQSFSILDVGGGSGLFADILLETFPNASVTIVDLSQGMLDQNKAHVRKTLVCSDAESFLRSNQKNFDFINFDVMLHHLIRPSFHANRAYQREMVLLAKSALQKDGYLSIWELIYYTFPFLPRNFAHRLIWKATTLSLPPQLKSILQRIGLKSQGAGVCFFDDVDLKTLFESLNLKIVAELKKDEWGKTLPFKLCAVQKVAEINYIIQPW